MKNLALLLIGFIFIASCTSSTDKTASENNEANVEEISDNVIAANPASLDKDVVEVYYFHGEHRCGTCIAVGETSESAVNENFAVAIEQNQVVFSELNIEDEINEKIVEEFELAGSGLFIRAIKDGKEEIDNLTEFAFMNAVNNPDTLQSLIKQKISSYL